MNKHQEAINNLLALLNARLYEKKKKNVFNYSSMMVNHDYIIHY